MNLKMENKENHGEMFGMGTPNTAQDYSKTDNNSSKDNDDLEDFIIFNMINKHK